MSDFELHPSRLATWGACEAKAMAEWAAPPTAKRPGRPSINTWVGSAVHAGVAGELIPDPPEIAVYNKATPTEKVAWKQVYRMIEAVNEMLDAEQWHIREHEVEVFGEVNGLAVAGTIDLIVEDALGETVILDLKTGDLPPFGAWVQVACYRHVHEMHHPDLTYAPHVGVIAVRRTPTTEDQEPPVVEKRNQEEVWNGAAAAWLKRVKQLHFFPERSTPTRSPGWHCKSCVAAGECPVAAS